MSSACACARINAVQRLVAALPSCLLTRMHMHSILCMHILHIKSDALDCCMDGILLGLEQPPPHLYFWVRASPFHRPIHPSIYSYAPIETIACALPQSALLQIIKPGEEMGRTAARRREPVLALSPFPSQLGFFPPPRTRPIGQKQHPPCHDVWQVAGGERRCRVGPVKGRDESLMCILSIRRG
ncbi:hypothetical protein V8C44DRAFT_339487 [Trichoderma aethiopicum]